MLYQRSSMELGLVAVLATQLWHHTFIDPTLANLPDWRTLSGLSSDERDLDFARARPGKHGELSISQDDQA